MKQLFATFLLVLLIVQFCDGQDYFFQPGKSLNYSFEYINANKDTVALGTILITPTDDTWQYDSRQKEVSYKYSFEKRDDDYFQTGAHGLPISTELEETTGYIEKDDSFWTHPFRENIFYITEIAPFPYFSKGPYKLKSKEVLYIGEGWGEFIGKSKRNYNISSMRNGSTDQPDKQLKKVKRTATHKLGRSFLEMIVSDEESILEMKYKFFNKDRLMIKKIK